MSPRKSRNIRYTSISALLPLAHRKCRTGCAHSYLFCINVLILVPKPVKEHKMCDGSRAGGCWWISDREEMEVVRVNNHKLLLLFSFNLRYRAAEPLHKQLNESVCVCC